MAIPVILPRQGQSVESCIFTEWHVKVGDKVKSGDLIYTYETDKASFEGEAPEDGILLAVFVEEGDEVEVLRTIAVIGNAGEDYSEFMVSDDEEVSDQSSEFKNSVDIEPVSEAETSIPAILQSSGQSFISPRARKTAERLRINPDNIIGSGPYGRIIEQDILAKAGKIPKSTPLARAISYSDHLDLPTRGSGAGGKVTSEDLRGDVQDSIDTYTDIKLSNIRKIIADNMYASIQSTAQLTLHASADARVLQENRRVIKNALEDGKTDNITINDMICYAVIRALKDHPDINSHFLGDKIRQFSKVHLGIAVDTPRGLMVPTLKNADDLTIHELSKNLKGLVNQVIEGNISPDILLGASFTVTNLGVLGIEMFTPVLNPPQAGILGINKIILQPEDIGGGVIAFVPRMGLSLTFDHKAIDGAPAARFLQSVINQIENLEIS